MVLKYSKRHYTAFWKKHYLFFVIFMWILCYWSSMLSAVTLPESTLCMRTTLELCFLFVKYWPIIWHNLVVDFDRLCLIKTFSRLWYVKLIRVSARRQMHHHIFSSFIVLKVSVLKWRSMMTFESFPFSFGKVAQSIREYQNLHWYQNKHFGIVTTLAHICANIGKCQLMGWRWLIGKF